MFRKIALLINRMSPSADENKRSTGLKGESRGAEHLKKMGFEILERNYRCKIGEIDIIVRREKRIHFVEVRTRTDSGKFGSPEESVDVRKRLKIVRVAQWYLKERKLTEAAVSFSVLGVLMPIDNKTEFHWIENAFMADGGM